VSVLLKELLLAEIQFITLIHLLFVMHAHHMCTTRCGLDGRSWSLHIEDTAS
jgi:hypothetical protein